MKITEELAWLAGFIDGDGYISICWRGSKPPYKYLRAIVGATQANFEIICYLRDRYGGHISTWKNKEGIGVTKKQQFQWAMEGTCAEELIVRLTPYLKIKREQALIVKEFSGLSINGRKNKESRTRQIECREKVVSLNNYKGGNLIHENMFAE